MGAKRANDWGITMIAIQIKDQMRGSQETKQECGAYIGDMSFLQSLYFAHVGQHSSLQLAAGKDPTAQLRV